MFCAIWYHLYKVLYNVQALAFNFTKSNTPLWVFLKFLKLFKWYQTAQKRLICTE